MTADKKAKELVEKFIPLTKNFDERHGWVEDIEAAKRCAILAVENEKQALIRFSSYWDITNGEWHKDELAKIESVKQSIKKL